MLALLACLRFCLLIRVLAQTSVSTGSIVGHRYRCDRCRRCRSPKSRLPVPQAKRFTATSSGTGAYSSGALVPGAYQVRVEAKGFKTAQLSLNVEVDNAANGSVKLEIGQESTVVEVQASEVQVNTEQATFRAF